MTSDRPQHRTTAVLDAEDGHHPNVAVVHQAFEGGEWVERHRYAFPIRFAPHVAAAILAVWVANPPPKPPRKHP